MVAAPVERPRAAAAARAGTAAARRAPPGRRRRCAAARRRGALGRSAPGRITGSRRGRRAASGRAVASKDARRASRRPKNSSTKRRATCVESTRSAGKWKVPTLSARQWRSATEEALGANGSCTWTKSSGAASAASSIVREMSSGGAGTRRAAAPASGSSSPTAEHAHLAVGAEQLARADAPARLAHERGSARRREHHHAVPARRRARRDSARDVGVDLVRVLPGIRRDLGDGERLRHGGSKLAPPARRSAGARACRPGGSARGAASAGATAAARPSRAAAALLRARVLGDELLGRLARLVVRGAGCAATS